jgi:hypothetical protein
MTPRTPPRPLDCPRDILRARHLAGRATSCGNGPRPRLPVLPLEQCGMVQQQLQSSYLSSVDWPSRPQVQAVALHYYRGRCTVCTSPAAPTRTRGRFRFACGRAARQACRRQLWREARWVRTRHANAVGAVLVPECSGRGGETQSGDGAAAWRLVGLGGGREGLLWVAWMQLVFRMPAGAAAGRAGGPLHAAGAFYKAHERWLCDFIEWRRGGRPIGGPRLAPRGL